MRLPVLARFAVAAMTVTAAARASVPLADAAFLDVTRQAMTTMMGGMAAAPSGNADRDFAVMMIPHHQGAIDMAVAELRFGHDEKLRRIAQEIIVDQQQEIVAMRAALGSRPTIAASMPMTNGSNMP